MSAHPFAQATDATRTVLEGVTAAEMADSTPCASWTVSQLVNHIVGTTQFFLAATQGNPPAGGDDDYSASDYVGAFNDASAQIQEVFTADGFMDKTISLPFGDMPGSAVVGLTTTDIFTHGWDLAKATGQSTDLAPGLAEELLTQARAMIPESYRGPEGAPFGPETECPDGASAADRLAAFLGRTV